MISFKANRDLVLNLVSKEIKVRYMGATLGFLWSLGNPIMVISTYFVVFTWIMPSSQDRFALHLVTGVLHWALFSQIILMSSDWLTSNSNLIRKVNFLKVTIPISGGLTIMAFWSMAFLTYALMYIPLGGKVTSAIFVYPFVLFSFLMFSFGIGLALSVIAVIFRDVKHIIEVTVPLLFWLTPIVWSFNIVPHRMRDWLLINPLAVFFNSFSSIFHDGLVPPIFDLILSGLLGIFVLLIGYLVFNRLSQNIVEQL